MLARRDGGTNGFRGDPLYAEAQARRVQIEGFVGDVVRRCGIEPLCEAAMEAVVAKLEKS